MILRAYLAAKTTGKDRLFRPQQSSGAQEIQDAWQTVTNKARDLDRNNPYVVGMRKRFVSALIGEGSWPRPKITKRNSDNQFDYDKELNQDILRRWENWADDACANADTIYQLQRIAARHFFTDGSFLIRRVYQVVDGVRKLSIEGLEFDYLDDTRDVDNGSKRIVNGIEMDQYNRPLAYWLKSRFPSEYETVSTRIEAKDVILLFDRNRASDITGISQFASVVENLYSIGEYRTATMNLARVATGYGVFVESPYPQDFFGAQDLGEASTGTEYQYVDPGGVHYLRPGEKIGQVKPDNPGSNYMPFMRTELQAASVGAGMSYESVSNDGSQSNFSSTRQMLLFERAMARYHFSLFEEQFFNKIYQWFIEFEVDFRGLKMPGFDKDKKRYLKVSWSRPKTEWVDPLKDVKSAQAEVDLGINSLTELAEVAGRDIEEVVATKKYEKELFESAGLTSSVDESVQGEPSRPLDVIIGDNETDDKETTENEQ